MHDRHLSRRNVLIGLAAGAGAVSTGAATILLRPHHAGAAAGGPDIIDDATWGARPPSEPIVIVPARPTKIMIHHTATPNSTDLSRAHAISLARSIQNSHMDTRGFKDTGQHFTVSRGSFVLEGRHESLSTLRGGTTMVESAHCFGQNRVSIGIENEGLYTSVSPSPAHYATLLDLCTELCTQYGISTYQVYGHRDFNNTECPGTMLYGMLPRLRSDLAARLGGDPTRPVWPTVRQGEKSERVRSMQFLLRQAGATIEADSDFGPATVAAVKAFQDVNGASIDGVAGNQTWNQAVFTLTRGGTGEAVRAAQTQLSLHGIATTVDGQFGPGTERSVRTFQGTAGLPVDGRVDARSWSHLIVP